MGKPKRKQANQFNDSSQSESWECPRSAQKHFNSSSRVISSRRASLRSAKKFAETAKPSVSRCLQPQISREHCSATNVFKQPDDRVQKIISATPVQAGSDVESPSRLIGEVAHPSRCSQPQISREHCSATNVFQLPDDRVETVDSAIQVQAGSDVQSPSRLLKQGAQPSTFTPEMSPENTMEVENLVATENGTVYTGETEEVRESEIILNHLNQMEWQKAVLAKCSPPKMVPSAKEFQVSTTLEERANKSRSKSGSKFGPAPSSFSLNLTQLVIMCADEDDEVDSVTESLPVDKVEGYEVNPNCVPVLRKILSKHGDIAENCSLSSMKYRSKLLEMICEIVSVLQGKKFSKIKDDDLNDMITLVHDIKNVKVDIEWLHWRLDEIREARKIFKKSGMLKEAKDTNREVIDTAVKELGECEAKKKAMEAMFRSIREKETAVKETLAKAKDESTKISETIRHAKSKVIRFLNGSLVDDLL